MRVRNLLKVRYILPQLKPVTILSTITMNSSHHGPLKLIIPPLVVVRDERSHDSNSVTETHNMRIWCKIDNIGKGVYNLPGAAANSPLVKIFPGHPLCTSLLLEMNPMDNHLQADTVAHLLK